VEEQSRKQPRAVLNHVSALTLPPALIFIASHIFTRGSALKGGTPSKITQNFKMIVGVRKLTPTYHWKKPASQHYGSQAKTWLQNVTSAAETRQKWLSKRSLYASK
jgi:hypothetical protein